MWISKSDDIYTHAELGQLSTVEITKEKVRPSDRTAAILRPLVLQMPKQGSTHPLRPLAAVGHTSGR